MTVVIAQDKKSATIHYDNGKSINLHHSDGRVEDLVILMLMPCVTTEISLPRLINSLQDTSEISVAS